MNFDIKNSRDFWEKIYCNRIVTDIRYLHILRRVFDKERTIKNTGTDWVVVATPVYTDQFDPL